MKALQVSSQKIFKNFSKIHLSEKYLSPIPFFFLFSISSAHGSPAPALSWLDSMEQPVTIVRGQCGGGAVLKDPSMGQLFLRDNFEFFEKAEL